MIYAFPRYLLSKQTVDDRALNKDVLAALRANLPAGPLSIIEVGAGIGTMLVRLLRWEVISRATYTLVDEQAENIDFARKWLAQWAQENGLKVEQLPPDRLRLLGENRDVSINLVWADVFDFIRSNPAPADLLIAHAFLDLLPMPASLPGLLSLTESLAWLTLNFDGVTTFEPAIEPETDSAIEAAYHRTMDTRPGGGDSQSGRHLFGYLEQAGIQIASAGASDWVVYPLEGQYPADEAYFLQFILHFFEESLGPLPKLPDWLAKRREQVERGQLTYIAHQMDFLVRVKPV